MIHHEATSILFGRNVFRLLSSTPKGVTKWLETITVRNFSMLRYVRISADHMLREFRHLSCAFPFMNRFDMRPRSVEMFNRPLSRIMAASTNQEVLAAGAAFRDSIRQAADDAVADQISAIHLLQACPSIMCLDILLPRSWSFHKIPFIPRENSYHGLHDRGETHKYDDVFNALAELNIAVELRIGADYARRSLENAIRSTRVQEAVLYAVSRRFQYVEYGDTPGHGQGWRMAPCGREKRLRLHPATATNLADERIMRLWPRPHRTTCTPRTCRWMWRPE